VIAVAGGAAKAAYCRSLGADVVVDHHEEDLAEAIRASTAGQGAGVVFDPVGGAPGERAVGAMRRAGRLLLVGFASGRWPTIDPGAVVEGNVTVMGVYVGAYDRAHAEATYTELHSLLERGRLRPLPTEQVAFTDLPRALGALADRTVMGRLVVSPRRPSEASE
jgi:NADPH2:quinone reductase